MQTGQGSGPRGGARPSRAYDVGFDRKGVEKRVLDPDKTRFTVALHGPMDDRWRREYRAVQLDSTDLFRYRLDMETDKVTFIGRGDDSETMFLLDRLTELVAQVNRRASS